jgi:uncharacterized membrane protein
MPSQLLEQAWKHCVRLRDARGGRCFLTAGCGNEDRVYVDAMNPRPPGAHGGELAGVVHRNIHALIEVRRAEAARRSASDLLADRVSLFAGSISSVIVHGIVFIGWITWNVLPGTPKFDPYPFVMLAVLASVEAIFLSTFVLISQNRQALISEKNAQLDLQVNLLAEHEVTRLIALTEQIAQKVGVPVPEHALQELKKDVVPERVLAEIDRTQGLHGEPDGERTGSH